MDSVSIIFFIVFSLLIIISAIIAYYGNNFGKHNYGFSETNNPYIDAKLTDDKSYFENTNAQRIAQEFRDRRAIETVNQFSNLKTGRLSLEKLTNMQLT